MERIQITRTIINEIKIQKKLMIGSRILFRSGILEESSFNERFPSFWKNGSRIPDKDEISTNEDNFGNLDQLLDDDLNAMSPEHYDLVEAGDVPGSPNNDNWAKPPFKNQYMLKRGGKRTSGGKPKKMRLEGFKLEEDDDDNEQDLECENETFECKICGDSYDSEEKLKKHLQSNKVWNGGTFLKCAKCQKGFHTESALNKHVAHGHPELLFDRSPAISFNTETGEVKWKCNHDSCQMVFDQNLSAQIHDVMFHRDFNNYQHNFQCQECMDWFETAQELNLHTSLAHKEKPAEKDFTDKFADTGNAVKGEKDRERRSEVCKYPGCGKQCRNYWELAIHTRSNHPSDIATPEKRTYPTVKYGKNLYHYHKDLYLLKKDHELHKTTLKKRNNDNIISTKAESEGYLCPVPRCDRIFQNTSVYYTHVEIHNLVGWPKNDSQRCFPCDQCNKSYDNSKALDGHRHTKHNPYYKGYSCPEPLCEVISASRAALNAHMLTHTAIRPYQCKLCGKAYKQKTTLHDHMISVHEKTKNFKCTVDGCDKSFHFKYDLLAHVRRHTGEKPYQCEQCGFRTSTAGGLRTHKISHSDARPYACEHCGATYKQTKHLNRHQKICTGASKVALKPSPVKKLEPRMPIRQILSADDLSVDLSAALINDSQLTESLSMVINTDQLRDKNNDDDEGTHQRLVLTSPGGTINDYLCSNLTKHEDLQDGSYHGQETTTIHISSTDDHQMSVQTTYHH